MATFNGTEGNDTLIGGSAADDLHGFGGNDFLQGGDGADTVLGDGGNDTMSGNAGNDWVRGGTGNDQVSGGGGQDSFAFHDFGATNADVLTDFSGGWDNIHLDVSAFSALGTTGRFSAGDTRFRLGASAQDADDRIIYNQATGQLWYDADGNGAGSAQLIATLSNRSSMSATDIHVFQSATPPPSGTINGTSGDDSLVGTAGDDTILGLGGNDTLDGRDGNDSLDGGTGNDSLLAGTGANVLAGGDGNDSLFGGFGDTLRGGLGDDSYFASAGAVIVESGGIDTQIAGGSIHGLASGVENLVIQSGFMDVVGWGNELDNVIRNQADATGHIDGADGNDTLIGGGETDDFGFQRGSGNIGNDVVDGGGGFNHMSVGAFSAVTADFRTGTVMGGGTGGSGSISFVDIDAIYAGNFNDRLTADDLGRTLSGGGGSDTVTGGAGNDVLIFDIPDSSAQTDILAGGGGTDIVSVQSASTAVVIDLAAGTLSAGAGQNASLSSIENASGSMVGDRITGNAGANLLHGSYGNDTLNGGAGNDTLDGGGPTDGADGDVDTFVFDVAPGATNADLVQKFLGGEDKIVLDGAVHANSGSSGTLAAGDARFYAAAGASAGHDADDRIVYNTSTGQLWYDADGSGAGAAQLIATLEHYSWEAPPTLNATDISIVNGTTPPPSAINGTAGNDSLVGTDGNDTINGFGGNDTIDGRGGEDSMTGGAGDDVYVVDSEGDVIVEFENGGIDQVRTDNTSYTLPAWVNNLTLFGDSGRTGIGNDIDNVIDGTHMEGVNLWGMGGNDVLLSGDFSGIHQLHGGDGNDTLRGGDHSDWLFGDAGNDVLDGGRAGSGIDTLEGGAGADDFLLTSIPSDAFFASSITDFASGMDEIRFDGRAFTQIGASGDFVVGDGRFHSGAGANTAHDADDRVIYNTSTGQVWYDSDGTGAAAAQLITTLQGAPTFLATDIAVDNGTAPPPAGTNGTDGNDTMIGTAGSDTLNGLGGNDFMQGQGSADTLRGGAGNDTMGGNDGTDWVEGGTGNDRLTGGSAQDAFVFREFGAANADTLTDFAGNNWDSLRFDNAAFTALGGDGRFASGDARFRAGTAAQDADDRIVWNSATGQVWYDADGNGAGSAQLVATLQAGATLVASDIWVV